MDNIITYLRKQGDVSFDKQAFNEVDNLVLSQLSYVEFDGIVPPIESGKSITVAEASRAYFSKHSTEEILASKSLTRLSPTVLKEMAAGIRYKNARLLHYSNKLDEAEGKQFAALHIALDDGTDYVSFRGSDNHMVAWQEDFDMSYMSVPAQVEAVCFLEYTMGNCLRPFRVGGHSKGGNLAVYSAISSPSCLQNRIINVYNNDGPGILREIVESAEHQTISNRIVRITPEFSIIGTLFEQIGTHIVVGSSAKGLKQHDAMTWAVEGTQFTRKESVDNKSAVLSRALNKWIMGFEKEQRRAFVTSFFGSLRRFGAITVSDISGSGILKVLRALNPLNSINRAFIVSLIRCCIRECTASTSVPLHGELASAV